MNSTLHLDDVSKTYSGNILALSNANLRLESGIFGLLGPNGAGKTTLLRLIATLLRPSTGSIELNGLDSSKNRKEYRANLGYLPQQFGLYPHLTAFEHILYFTSLKGMKNTSGKKEAYRLLEEVGLREVADHPVGSFSGGMKQRVGIAGAMVGSPRLLVVDEPTAGLDPEERIRFRNLIEQHSRDSIVVLSTHIVQDIELGCQRLAVMADGKILYDASPGNLSKSAQGKTWQAEIFLSELRELERIREVIFTRNLTEEIVQVRFSGERLGLGEEAVEPTLEDAYINLIANHKKGTW